MNANIIAQILGIILLIMGLSLMINKKGVASLLEEVSKSVGLLWIYGFIALSMGAVMVTLNNYWTSGLPLFITILGWLTLIKGIYILVFPATTISLYRKFNKSHMFFTAGLISFVLGLLLMVQ